MQSRSVKNNIVENHMEIKKETETDTGLNSTLQL